MVAKVRAALLVHLCTSHTARMVDMVAALSVDDGSTRALSFGTNLYQRIRMVAKARGGLTGTFVYHLVGQIVGNRCSAIRHVAKAFTL